MAECKWYSLQIWVPCESAQHSELDGQIKGQLGQGPLIFNTLDIKWFTIGETDLLTTQEIRQMASTIMQPI